MPDLAPVDAPEDHPATTAPENKPQGQDVDDAEQAEAKARWLARQAKKDAERAAEQLDRIRRTLIPRGWCVHPLRDIGYLASAAETNRLFFDLESLGRWAAAEVLR